jgi:hypothetical protein
MTSLDLLDEALQSAATAWTGCDWDTEFGPHKANLRGLCSRQARLAAQATRGEESARWREVCQFLEAVEQDARRATELVCGAIGVWRLGNELEALRRLDDAIALEARYREPVAYTRIRDLMQVNASCSVQPGNKIADAGKVFTTIAAVSDEPPDRR